MLQGYKAIHVQGERACIQCQCTCCGASSRAMPLQDSLLWELMEQTRNWSCLKQRYGVAVEAVCVAAVVFHRFREE